MDTIVNWLVATVGRFFRWMLGCRNGWIFMGIVIFMIMMKFHPELLAQFVSNTVAWVINLLARIIEANRKSIEYLFCIALLCFGIVMMFRAVFGKKGGGTSSGKK